MNSEMFHNAHAQALRNQRDGCGNEAAHLAAQLHCAQAEVSTLAAKVHELACIAMQFAHMVPEDPTDTTRQQLWLKLRELAPNSVPPQDIPDTAPAQEPE